MPYFVVNLFLSPSFLFLALYFSLSLSSLSLSLPLLYYPLLCLALTLYISGIFFLLLLFVDSFSWMSLFHDYDGNEKMVMARNIWFRYKYNYTPSTNFFHSIHHYSTFAKSDREQPLYTSLKILSIFHMIDSRRRIKFKAYYLLWEYFQMFDVIKTGVFTFIVPIIINQFSKNLPFKKTRSFCIKFQKKNCKRFLCMVSCWRRASWQNEKRMNNNLYRLVYK